MDTYNDYIHELLRDDRVSLVGFADLAEIPQEQRDGLRYGVCIGIALKVFPSLGEATQDYYREYKDVSRRLREISYKLEEKIREQGFAAYSLARNHQDEHFCTKLPFKTLATRAGLGWIGRSAVLVTRKYGSAVRLSGVITDMPFETGTPVNTSQCGECRACVDACPAGAIVGNHWDVNVPRDALLDPYRCKAKVIERGEAMGVRDGSCGICLRVCPWTKKYISSLRET